MRTARVVAFAVLLSCGQRGHSVVVSDPSSGGPVKGGAYQIGTTQGLILNNPCDGGIFAVQLQALVTDPAGGAGAISVQVTDTTVGKVQPLATFPALALVGYVADAM